MWLRRAASTRSRVGMTSLFRSLQQPSCVANSMSRCAIPLRHASSTSSSQPQLASKPAKPVIDLGPARRVLRETFGHKTFRPGQEEVIPRLLSGESMVIAWPPRSGASICYLVPAVLESSTVNHGITVVISVSKSFLRHKVETLCELGIHVDVISPVNPAESPSFKKTRNAALDGVRTGKTRILYLFSQYSADRDVLHAIRSAPGGVHRVVVEDATQFTTLETQVSRPIKYDVDKIKRLIQGSRPKSVVVLASGCHPDVVEDVRRHFDLLDSSSHSIPILPPPNLELHAYANPDEWTARKNIVDLMRRRPGPTVLYATRGKLMDDIVKLLKKAGLSVKATTGNLTTDETKEILSCFEASKFDILCTISPAARIMEHHSIRNVVIISLPSSVSTVYREMSVAGHDGGWSKIFMAISTEGMRQSETAKRSGLPCRRDVRVLLNEIFFRGRASTTNLNYLDIGRLSQELDFTTDKIEYVVEVLRDQLGLIVQEDTEFASCTFKYHQRGFDLAKSASPIDKAIAADSIKSGGLHHLQLLGARGHTKGFNSLEVVTRLRELSVLGQLTLYLYDRRLKVRILKQPSLGSGPDSIRAIEDSICAHLQRDLEVWKRSQQEVIELFTKDRCTSVGLVEHFGTELPGGRTRCERCDWCLTGKPLVLPSDMEEDEVDPGMVKAVLNAVPDRDNPRFLARFAAGVVSQRSRDWDLTKSRVFRSMRHVNFDALVRVFAKKCGVPDDEVNDWL